MKSPHAATKTWHSQKKKKSKTKASRSEVERQLRPEGWYSGETLPSSIVMLLSFHLCPDATQGEEKGPKEIRTGCRNAAAYRLLLVLRPVCHYFKHPYATSIRRHLYWHTLFFLSQSLIPLNSMACKFLAILKYIQIIHKYILTNSCNILGFPW